MDDIFDPDELVRNNKKFADWVFRSQMTEEQRRFQDWLKAVKAAQARPRDEKAKEALKKANDGIIRLKSLSPNDVHNDSTLTNLSVMYANPGMIGDRLMPFIPSQHRSDIYFTYDKRSMLAFPDDSLSGRGEANEVKYTLGKGNFSCKDHGLDGYVDISTMQNADAPLDPLIDETLHTNEGIVWNRELRIANVVTNTANYNGNVLNIASGSEWDSAGGGTPIKDIQFAIDSTFEGRGNTQKIGFCNIDVFRALSRHPAILNLYNAPTGGRAPGLVTRQQIAQYFELDDLLVGRARKDTANSGQSASYSRIFGKFFGVLHVANAPNVRTAAFGYSFRFGQLETFVTFERKRGLRGSYTVGVRTSEDHVVVAADTGFLIANAIQ